jgi:hypothetical protein
MWSSKKRLEGNLEINKRGYEYQKQEVIFTIVI